MSKFRARVKKNLKKRDIQKQLDFKSHLPVYPNFCTALYMYHISKALQSYLILVFVFGSDALYVILYENPVFGISILINPSIKNINVWFSFSVSLFTARCSGIGYFQNCSIISKCTTALWSKSSFSQFDVYFLISFRIAFGLHHHQHYTQTHVILINHLNIITYAVSVCM